MLKLTQGLINNLDAKKIREEVFIKEQGFINEFDDIDDVAYHIVLYKNGVAVATGRLFSEDNYTCKIGRVAVLKAYRKQHFGELIIKNLEEKAKELGAKQIHLSAQVQAKGFYKKLNYKCIGGVYLDEECLHILMAKSLN